VLKVRKTFEILSFGLYLPFSRSSTFRQSRLNVAFNGSPSKKIRSNDSL